MVRGDTRTPETSVSSAASSLGVQERSPDREAGLWTNEGEGPRLALSATTARVYAAVWGSLWERRAVNYGKRRYSRNSDGLTPCFESCGVHHCKYL